MKKNIAIFLILAIVALWYRSSFFSFTEAQNYDNFEYLSRGGAIAEIVKVFDLQNREKFFLDDCAAHPDDCFFVFGAMSHFDNMSFKPLILYPDVSLAYRFYDDINVATMLGLVHGYIEEKNSPFYPRASITRIQALKVILGAAKLLPWKERFEIISQLGGESALKKQKTIFEDVRADTDHMWWYFRYVNFATDAGFVGAEGKYFRPDEAITQPEFEGFLKSALKLTRHSTR